MLCIALSAAPLGLKCLACLLNSYGFINNIKRHAWLQHPAAIIEIWTNTLGEWHLRAQNGKVYTAQLQGSTLLTRFLVILNFKRIGSRFGVAVLLFPDATEMIIFRRLCAYLKTEQQAQL